MQTSLKANLLKHLIAKKEEGGFTLIELLVVIIIIGILAAIALPSFLNQANRARQSEATTYVGSMNRAQQAYYLERGRFTEELGQLGLGIAAETDFYSYDIESGDIQVAVTNQAKPDGTDAAVRAYLGVTYVGRVDIGGDATEATTQALLCEGANPPVNGGPVGDEVVARGAEADNFRPNCPEGYVGGEVDDD